ncbi:MAG: cytochrome C biogenesis protein, partial [Cryomorphaceae bacterium]|nr:cytochrome C biogenesis protein [Cryomorphaceae bacterium]
MSRIVSFVFAVLAASSSFAQILDPVSWEFSVKKISDERVDIIAKATIDKTWHLYSSEVPDDDMGPIPTTFYTDSSGVKFTYLGHVKESPKPASEFDPNFQMDVKYHSDKATFTIPIKV